MKGINSGNDSLPDSLIPSGAGQPATEKRGDKAFKSRQEGEANLWAATKVNVVSASLPPPAIKPIERELTRGEPVSARRSLPRAGSQRGRTPVRRDGVEDGGTQGKFRLLTGETRLDPAEETPHGREAYKGETRKRGNEAEAGIGGGHSTVEPRESRGEGRAATSIRRPKMGKAAGLPPRGKAQPRPKSAIADGPCPRTSEALSRWPSRTVGARHRTKMVGEPDAGKPHVRFDEGVQETCDRVTRLCPTLPKLCDFTGGYTSNQSIHRQD